MKKMEVLMLGEPMAMFIAKEVGEVSNNSEFTLQLAGSEVNVAIGLARLGINPYYVTKLGDDMFGSFIIERLKSESIETSHIILDKSSYTGFQFKNKVNYGDPKVHYYRKSSAINQLRFEEIDYEIMSAAKALHITGIPLALSESIRNVSLKVLELFKEQGNLVFFDPNIRLDLWDSQDEMITLINEVAFNSDYFLPGLKEAEQLTGFTDVNEIAKYYLSRGTKTIVIKLESNGAFYQDESGCGYVEPIIVEKVVDTVGAGDGFAVGVISGILEGLSIEEAVKRGNKIGSLAVQVSGDHENYPSRKDLESM